MPRRFSPFMRAVQADRSLPIDHEAVKLWLKDLQNPLRWVVRPVLQVVFSILLHVIWALKRLPLPQFRAHGMLQRTICWFCRNLVSREANLLILRHYATESNILNFLRDNSSAPHVAPIALYPGTTDELLDNSFVRHDQELFRMFEELAERAPSNRRPERALDWTHWRPLKLRLQDLPQRRTQVLDFETSHALFMCVFCLLLTAEEYRDSINGFNLDHSIAIRIGRIIGDATLTDYVYNKYPLYPVGPANLPQRFLMHGFFTEHLHARLEQLRATPGVTGV
jgi:hypothetical protein